MKPGRVLLLLLVTVGAAQKPRESHKPEWDHRNEAGTDRINSRGCANLTLVLDNWKYAIMTQVKDLLLQDHSIVLPDYGRIQPLSDALGGLYKEFNTMKDRLVELTSKFEGVEAFVDSVRSGRRHALPRGVPQLTNPLPAKTYPAAPHEVSQSPGRRTRIVVRRLKTPEGSQD